MEKDDKKNVTKGKCTQLQKDSPTKKKKKKKKKEQKTQPTNQPNKHLTKQKNNNPKTNLRATTGQ